LHCCCCAASNKFSLWKISIEMSMHVYTLGQWFQKSAPRATGGPRKKAEVIRKSLFQSIIWFNTFCFADHQNTLSGPRVGKVWDRLTGAPDNETPSALFVIRRNWFSLTGQNRRITSMGLLNRRKRPDNEILRWTTHIKCYTCTLLITPNERFKYFSLTYCIHERKTVSQCE